MVPKKEADIEKTVKEKQWKRKKTKTGGWKFLYDKQKTVKTER